MGTITKGILGGFSGKVGTVIGGSWKGIDYMRGIASRQVSDPSQRQKEQQAKFKLMIQFLSQLTGLLDVGFRNYAIRKTGINAALGYNLKNAVTGTYPLYTVNYPQVLVSRGDLPGAVNAAVTSLSSGEIKFSWNDNSDVGKAAPDDRVMLLAYSPERKQGIYVTAGVQRDDMEAILAVDDFSGLEVHTYISFISADNRDVAASVYAGEITVL